MAPKVETWVDRKGNIKTEDKEEDLLAAAATQSRTSAENHIKQNQVAIDGIIYDLDSFDHPGGDSINMFGGNDVSVLYRMIHPRHNEKYHTQKLKQVGTIKGYKSEYKFGSAFEHELKREVFKIVRPGQERGTTGYLARVCVYLAFYFVLQVRQPFCFLQTNIKPLFHGR
jgi:fatty acid desaturase (delta-4 desaturase)